MKDRILLIIKRKGKVTGSELCRELNISRQALNRHIRRLMEEGTILREGTTRGAKYHPADGSPSEGPRVFARTFLLKNLQEDRVFDQVVAALGLTRALPANVRRIVEYAFTEMLNNAVEHSHAEQADVCFDLSFARASFSVRDRGIGVFSSIARQKGLADETEALGELIKGKTTTMPERHSGEGIFFTSKLADRFEIRSHHLRVLFDNQRQDVFAGEARRRKGTEVHFEINRRSRKALEAVFAAYAPERHDYKFTRTRVVVKLFQRGLVSRSEARRLIAGLEKFKEVELDFRGVEVMGQGFADEVFRVFTEAHPHIQLTILNANPAVEAMIKHVSHAGEGHHNG